ncbi:monooxygenase [Enterobacter hormaechei]|nr:monooxygenase [Enterobacter hormaechei]ELD3252391.1 monooxygenase [Enterobacter hormaechei]
MKMHVKITAKLIAKMHLVLALVWAILTIPTLLWWKNSILWVSLMSIYAIVISHLAAYSAAHAEKAASKAMDKSEGASQKANQTAKSLQGNARQAH